LDKDTSNQETHFSVTAIGNRRLLITLYIITDNLALVGVVLAMYGLWQAIIRLPLGIAADWFGRCKPFIVACFALN
jgi:MFS family permease